MYPKTLKEAEEKYAKYANADVRLAAWKAANPSAAPAKKAEEKKKEE